MANTIIITLDDNKINKIIAKEELNAYVKDNEALRKVEVVVDEDEVDSYLEVTNDDSDTDE